MSGTGEERQGERGRWEARRGRGEEKQGKVRRGEAGQGEERRVKSLLAHFSQLMSK